MKEDLGDDQSYARLSRSNFIRAIQNTARELPLHENP